MSVLSLPRIHFSGFTDWSPSTANNAPNTYNEQDVEPFLQPGVTYDKYLAWLKDLNPKMQQPNGSWNVYGDHATQFTNTKVTAALTNSGPAAPSDPLLGAPVTLQGLVYSDGPAPARLVMTDPFTGGEATSQIFYQWLVLGNLTGPQENWIGFKAGAAGRIFSRWPYQTRNLGITFKEGMVGCVWQAASYNKDIEWFGLDRSPLLAALHAAATSGANQGLLMRFASYATLYYQAASFEGKKILNGEDLVAAYAKGYNGDNPARSSMVGTFGIWEPGELASAPSGRLLFPAASPQLTSGAGIAALGPAVARVDPARKVLTLDVISTFPEQSDKLDKADFGTLQLQARDASGAITPIGVLPYTSYDKHAYESTGGICEFPLPGGETFDLQTLELSQPIPNDTITVLRESPFNAESDDRCVYIDEGQTVSATVVVTSKAGPAPAAMSLLLAQYDSNGNLLAAPLVQVVDSAGHPVQSHILPVINGTAAFGIQSLAPGACYLAFYPFQDQPPTSIPQTGIPLPSTFYIAIRMLPFDNELERNTPDSQLSWAFIYTHVLRVFSLVYPVMSLVRNLSDRSVVEGMAEQLKFATSLDTFESTLYMPITRDLSAGKRLLLQRWVNLLSNTPPNPS